MKPIRPLKHFAFYECKGDTQYCSLCETKMKGNIGLTINKAKRTTNGYNVWFCLNCTQRLPEVINKLFEESKDQIMVESI